MQLQLRRSQDEGAVGHNCDRNDGRNLRQERGVLARRNTGETYRVVPEWQEDTSVPERRDHESTNNNYGSHLCRAPNHHRSAAGLHRGPVRQGEILQQV